MIDPAMSSSVTHSVHGGAAPLWRPHASESEHPAMSKAGSEAARILKLEEKVAYQDKIISELNDVVVALNRSMDGFYKRLEAVERTIQAELAAREQPNEKPPHY